MKRYTLLLADADGTLLDFDAAEDKALLAACAAMDIAIDEEQAAQYKRINEALWKAMERGEVTQADLRVLRFSRFFDLLRIQRDPEAMGEHFVKALSLQTDEIEGARDFLREASLRVPVVIVTNGISVVQRSRFERSPLNAYLSGHVISGELGFAKPDPRVIEAAVGPFDIPGAEVLMLGDSLTSDIAGANAAGIDSCWYNPHDLPNDTPHVPTYAVGSLREVLRWL